VREDREESWRASDLGGCPDVACVRDPLEWDPLKSFKQGSDRVRFIFRRIRLQCNVEES